MNMYENFSLEHYVFRVCDVLPLPPNFSFLLLKVNTSRMKLA